MIPSVVAAQLRRSVEDFLRATYPVSTPAMRGLLEPLFTGGPGGMVRGPFLALDLPYRTGDRDGEPFPDLPLGFAPFRHQLQAFDRLRDPDPQPTLIATGTGSGKTEAFVMPILDHCASRKGTKGIKALIIYPMNALATDQAKRIAAIIWRTPACRGVTAGLFIGSQDKSPDVTMAPDRVITDKEVMRQAPPDILLTNYKMLDYLLIRPKDQPLWQHNRPETLRYLVVDELHTFDGAQGTDLACLIRRLRARLGTPDDWLCCVGTSATLGSSGDPAPLGRYAGKLFGRAFDQESVITESRQGVGEFLADALVDPRPLPPPAEADALRPDAYRDHEAYLRAQHRLWFQDDIAGDLGDNGWRLALRRKLLEHPLFQNLLKMLQGRVRDLDGLIAELRQRIRLPVPAGAAADSAAAGRYHADLLDSLVALIAAARAVPKAAETAAGRGLDRFPNVRVQLWLRELARMVADVSPTPTLRFSDDLEGYGGTRPVAARPGGDATPETAGADARWHLPVVHCLDCHSTGWAGLVNPGESKVGTDLKSFYAAFFAFSDRVAFLFPDAERAGAAIGFDKGAHQRLCPRCLHLTANLGAERCPNCRHDPLIPVFRPDNTQFKESRTGGNRRIVTHDCPYCDSRNGLTIVGSRAASLTSVMIGSLFATRHNDEQDRRLIAFSDQVQDAAHRAGFYAARAHRITLRAALGAVIGQAGAELAVPDLIERFRTHWKAELGNAGYVGTFIATDMEWLHGYDDLVRTGQLDPAYDLVDLVDKRVAWEILSEFGLRARVGRTLETAGVATADLAPDRLHAAVSALLPVLRNEIGGLRSLTADRLQVFVHGLAIRLRLRGGLLWQDLDPYLGQRGSSFLLNRLPFMPGIGTARRAPSFFTDGHFDNSPLERVLAKSGRRTWCAVWAQKCFDPVDPMVSSYLDDLFGRTLAALVTHGVFAERPVGTSHRGWGLPLETVRVTPDPARLRCGRCRHGLTLTPALAAVWQDGPCLQPHCPGHYRADPLDHQAYYRRLYQSGRVQRVVAREHTGLLKREVREALERRFIAGDWPRDPNLLSATSTLEMGIDIGDLSTALMASIPPAPANYLQRIGRAGRRDGNALAVALAAARPHDLYFFAEPDRMLAGIVDPPGIFLDASAILQRQFTAFCFDRWVATGVTETGLPRTLGMVLNAVNKDAETAFPFTWLRFIETHQTALMDAFLALFRGDLSPETTAQLRAFAEGGGGDRTGDVIGQTSGGLRWHILDRLRGLAKEREAMRKKIRSLQKAVKAKDATVAKDKNHERDLGILRFEKNTLQQLVRSLEQRDTLNFFTDEGLIPNYTFPEEGVTLHSVIFRRLKNADAQGRRYETWSYDYQRAAPAAIGELAPSTAFYAEGRKVMVDQVDLSLSRPQTWRLCRECHHLEEEAPEAKPAAICPRCGDTLWSDAGQKRTLIKLRQVMARTDDRKSRIGDDADERAPAFYSRQMLVQFRKQHIRGAYVIDDPDFPFGFEFLDKATVRELNFGQASGVGPTVRIAGVELPRAGFTLCRHCGKLQPSDLDLDREGDDGQDDGSDDPGQDRARRRGQPVHDFTCSARDERNPANFATCVYLFRELTSEAIRILLPVTTFSGSDRMLHSFVAALQLGLRLRFEGSVDHLKVTEYAEPVPGTGHKKRFLVLYDQVPGGTGYLRQLMRDPDPLLEVVQAALDHIKACACNTQEPAVDGCYRCVYAYRNSYTMAETSRDAAKDLLAEIVRRRSRLTTAATVGSVEVNALFDSELEARFVEALRRARWQDQPVGLRKQVVNKKAGYALTIAGHAYEIEPQVAMGAADGVAVPVSIDFLVHPVRHKPGARPVAVFTDGFATHRKRIGLDLHQRTALIRSGKAWVVSLTWSDVESRLTGTPPVFTNLLSIGLNGALNQRVHGFLGHFGLTGFARMHDEGGFDWLLRLLAEPAHDLWRRLAFLRVMLHGDVGLSGKAREVQAWRRDLADRLPPELVDEAEDLAAPRVLGRFDHPAKDPRLWMLSAVSQAAVASADADGAFVALVFDDDPDQPEDDLVRHWGGVLRALILYQFIGRCVVTTKRTLAAGAFVHVPLPAVGPQTARKPGAEPEAEEAADAGGPADDGWTALTAEVDDPDLQALFDRMIAAGWPVPVPIFELADTQGAVVADAAVAWPDARIAILWQPDEAADAAFAAAGWQVSAIEELPAVLPAWGMFAQEGVDA